MRRRSERLERIGGVGRKIRTAIAIEHALYRLQMFTDLLARLHRTSHDEQKVQQWREKYRTFFLASPGGADSSLRMLSLRALMRSGGVLCFVLKKFIVLLSYAKPCRVGRRDGGGVEIEWKRRSRVV